MMERKEGGHGTLSVAQLSVLRGDIPSRSAQRETPEILFRTELPQGEQGGESARVLAKRALTAIQVNLQASLDGLNAYASNKNVAHITNAASQCEQNVLPLLWGLPQQVAELGEPTLLLIKLSYRQTRHANSLNNETYLLPR